jgi:peptidyl-dipeptidase Dcp
VEGGGPYSKEVAARLRKNIFTAGNTIDPVEGYRAFRGRDPQINALMRKRGFPMEKINAQKATVPKSKPVKKTK